MPARIIYSCIVVFPKAIIDIIDEIVTLVSKTGVFCLPSPFLGAFQKGLGLYTIWAGMDVLQSFFGGRLLSEPIFRPFLQTRITRIKNTDYTDVSGKKRAGAEVLSSGEEKLTAVRPFVSIFGLARMSSNSSGEEMKTPASPVIFRVGTKVLNFFGGRNATSTHPLLQISAPQGGATTIYNTDFRAGTEVLQKILRGKIFWQTPASPVYQNLRRVYEI